jgi:hypothetical protein
LLSLGALKDAPSRSFFKSGRDGGGQAPYILAMSTLLPVFLVIAMAATVIVLFTGILGFAFNSKLNAKYSTKLMTARVLLQGLALAVFAVIVLTQM